MFFYWNLPNSSVSADPSGMLELRPELRKLNGFTFETVRVQVTTCIFTTPDQMACSVKSKLFKLKSSCFMRQGKKKKRKETKAACWRWTTCSLDGTDDRWPGWVGYMSVVRTINRNRISWRTSLYCGPETTTTTRRRGYIRRWPGRPIYRVRTEGHCPPLDHDRTAGDARTSAAVRSARHPIMRLAWPHRGTLWE